VPMAATHQEEGRKHAAQRELHEQMKRRHHELLARFRMLVTSLESVVEK
jgi:hypothetical protein